MAIKQLIDKLDTFLTAIESVETLISDHDQVILRPILNHMKEQRTAIKKQIDNAIMNIDVQTEEIERLSNF
jgi:hypothetical protein